MRIPKAFASEARLEAGTEVEVSVSGGRIIVTPIVPEYLLSELVSGITPENRHPETDWGEPAGNESW